MASSVDRCLQPNFLTLPGCSTLAPTSAWQKRGMQQLGLEMDIRKWLAETRDPVSSQQPGLERFLLPRQPDAVPDARRRRKRGSSDSSLLKDPSPQPGCKGVSANKRDRYGVPNVADEGHNDRSHSGSSISTASSAVSQRYARKPRRKARADKYATGSKRANEQDEGQRPGRKSESRKSKRKKNEKTQNGIGKELQARNVSSDRSTLKPSEKIGLFSKGRTSTSVKGRGLPDLVFSEMKFLRNNHSGNNHTMQAPEAKKKRKKDHARAKEEDISAFFTTVRPVLANTDGNIQAKSGRPPDASARAKAYRPRRIRDPSKAPETAVPPVESEAKASYLGFGSKGPRHESTSHFSWSESICAPSVTPGQHRDISADHDKRIDAWTRETDQVSYGRGTVGHQGAPSSVIRDRVTATSNRFWVSSVAPTPSGLSRPQSLPQPSSSPRQPNLADRAVDRHTNDDVTSPPSMDPVLRRRVHAGHLEASMTKGSAKMSYVSGINASMQRRASTDVVRDHTAHDRPPQLLELDGTLQHYTEMSEAEPRQAPTRRGRPAEAQASARPPDSFRQSRHDLYRRTAEVPTVRSAAPDTHSSRLFSFSGPSIYVQQDQRQRWPVHLGLEDNGSYRYLEGYGQEHMSETGALDHEGFGELSDVQFSYGLREDVDEDVEGLDYVADGVEQVQEPEHTSVVTSGFWRPNRLY
ncbi:uncharacterized protein M421DRAFT_89572 [Didymella exigua CBS 183.55]|uniref:Uncharacterized protein n=1 Tax=Didymella exigua CBS 183.55 TaxID=1150837 RepID=A0A6A5RUW3_9PLEO|nr:uncharacterized protein M421DRAFT_89572 [Didymella exigua CBS 183.55]KAF1932241.1 hypothetical protein M421DRAFT_89572 [Didymella exigua CBS 183.55]